MSRRVMRSLLAAIVSALVPSASPAQGPAIAAASDLTSTLPEIAELFAARTGQRVRLTFGSSGTLAEQIVSGAPFEVFLAADASFVQHVAIAGRAEGTPIDYAAGRIGILASRRGSITADSALASLSSALRAGKLGKFAIANPEHAPYGRAAREALMHAGIWDDIRSHLVFGENVSQATQFAASGAADGGIIPQSLAMTDAVRRAGTFVLIPETWHEPLRQRASLVAGAGETAKAFFAFLQSPEAQRVFRRHGFIIPANY